MSRAGFAQRRLRINRLDPHLVHQTLDTLMIDGIPLVAHVNRHARPAVERGPHVLLVNQPHQLQVERIFRGRHVIIGGTI